MTRVTVLSALVVGSALSVAPAGYQGPPREGKTVQMQTLNVRDILYVVKGGGGNTMALMRDEGAVLIDTKLPGWGQPIRDAVAAVSDKPVATIINTNASLDRVGGNPEFPGVTQIIAHANTKANMQKRDMFKGANAKFVPNKTFTDRLTLLDGIDRIDLYYFGAGHSNGDIIVVFPEKHVAVLGDLFQAKEAPVIDTANGGSAVAFPQTLAKAIAAIKGVQRVITGHDTRSATPRARESTGSQIFANPLTMTWNDLQEYADFNRDFLAAVQEAMKAGKSADEAAATLKLPDRYKDYGMQQAKANVQTIYAELKK
jgi:glyoxylase-like metal-dependent hydrolase (beta-lactamase superfamily II)